MNYSDNTFEKLVSTIEEAINQAATELFTSTKEKFYTKSILALALLFLNLGLRKQIYSKG